MCTTSGSGTPLPRPRQWSAVRPGRSSTGPPRCADGLTIAWSASWSFEVVTYAQPWPAADLVLDGVGGDLVQRGVDVLRPGGRLVAFSAGGGAVDAGSLLGGLRTVTGFAIGAVARARPGEVAGYRAELWALLAQGLIVPRTVVFGWADAAAALDLVASRRHRGRVVLS